MCLLYMYRRLKWYLNVDAFCSLCNLSMMKSTSSSSAERQPYGGYLTWGEPPKSTVFRVIYTIPWFLVSKKHPYA